MAIENTTTVKAVTSGTQLTSVGTVKTVVGLVKAVDANGAERVLQVGDKVFANETIITSADGGVIIEFPNGSHLDLPRSAHIMLDPEIYSANASKSIEQEASDEAARIARAIAEGRDPNAVADPAAAGGETGDEGTTTPLVVDFDNTQGNVTSGFATGPISLSFPPPQEELPPTTITPAPPVVTVSVSVGVGVDIGGEPGGTGVILIPGGTVIPLAGVTAVDIPEGSSGGFRPVTFLITLSQVTTTPVTISYTIVPGTASNPEDFQDGALTGTITIPAGYQGFTITENIVEDTLVEGNESFTIVLSNPIGATLTNNTATVTIIDDDLIAQDDVYTANEGAEGVQMASVLSHYDATDDDVDVTQSGEDDAGRPGATLVVVQANGDPVPVGGLIITTVSGGSVLMQADGTFVYTAPGLQENGDEFNGLDSFQYTMTDGFNGTSTANVTVEVLPVNDLTDDNETNSTAEDTTLTVANGATGDLLNNSFNPDGPSDVTITKFTWGTNVDVAAGSTATIANVGQLTINANGSYTFVPATDYAGAVPVATYTVTDGQDTDTSTLTLSITAVNDATVIQNSHVWMSSDPAQGVASYINGYPLNVTIPTDVDSNLLVTATGGLTGVFYFDGTSYLPVTTTTVLYDSANNINYLDDLVYRPTSSTTDSVTQPLTLDVFNGTTHLTETVTIHEVTPNRQPADTATIGDGKSPLTSGNDQTTTLTLTQAFVDGISGNLANATIKVYTDFQESPFVKPIPLAERDPVIGFNSNSNLATDAGSQREQEVQVELRIGTNRFAIVEDDLTSGTYEQSWTYDSVTGLMVATVNYSQMYLLDGSGVATTTTLADYLAANPADAGDTWTLTYYDNDGGNYQARSVSFEFFYKDPGDPGIVVNGDAILSDTIYGTSGIDTLSGNGGADTIYGQGGNDILNGGAGMDLLLGGGGNDLLDAGLADGSTDTLIWNATDTGIDTVRNFTFGSGGDVLDLSDLLQGENSGNIESGGFLTSATYASGNTTLVFDTNGSTAGGANQTIVIEGVDLTNGGLNSTSQVLHQLLQDGNLKIDS